MSNILIMIENFNSFDLELSMPIIQVLMRYANNLQELNLVIDLMFSHTNTEEFDKYAILSDLHSPSNYAPLFVKIIIEKKSI